MIAVKMILAGAASIPLLLGLLVSATGLAIVDIHEDGPDGTRLVIPVPLVFGDAAMLFVDDEKIQMDYPEFGPHREAVLRLARELKNVPDSRLVEVSEPGQQVTVDKEGDRLVINIHDGNDEVRANVPVASLETLAERYDGKALRPRDLMAAARQARSGELVDIQDGNDRVRIWIW